MPKCPKEPIKKRGKGKITVKYNSKKRTGNFSKTITVYSNARNSPVKLKIKGKVEGAKPTPKRSPARKPPADKPVEKKQGDKIN